MRDTRKAALYLAVGAMGLLIGAGLGIGWSLWRAARALLPEEF